MKTSPRAKAVIAGFALLAQSLLPAGAPAAAQTAPTPEYDRNVAACVKIATGLADASLEFMKDNASIFPESSAEDIQRRHDKVVAEIPESCKDEPLEKIISIEFAKVSMEKNMNRLVKAAPEETRKMNFRSLEKIGIYIGPN